MRTDAQNKSMAAPCATCGGLRWLDKGQGDADRCPACNPKPRAA